MKVIYTIDVEGHDGENPFQSLVWGNNKHMQNQGIDKIMDLADEFGIKGLFFVDFAAAWEYGKENVSDVVNHIIERGHDVGVHIHPAHMDCSGRKFLSDYTYDEQFDLINKCTMLYKEITRKSPKSFRAGRYSANNDTLKILNKLGYRYDFSEFYGQKWCKISPAITSISPVRYDGIVEIPVTSFQSIKFGSYEKYNRLDGAHESFFFRYILKRARRIDNISVTMFSHSFSFIDWRGHPDTPFADEDAYRKTYANFVFMKEDPEIMFVSEKQLEMIDFPDYCEFPIIQLFKNPIICMLFILKTAYSIRRANRKARILIISLQIATIIVLLIVSLKLFGVY